MTRLQVATQFSTGPGLYLPGIEVVITSERVVSDTATAVISGGGIDDQLARIVLLDYLHDVALLRPAKPLGLPEPTAAEMDAFLEEAGLSLDLDAEQLATLMVEYVAGEKPAARCLDCERLVREGTLDDRGRCPYCGAQVTLPSMVTDAVATGVEATIEEIISAAGYDPRLSRRGPCLWSLRRGSATIQLAYHEESGLVTGDAYLCALPETPRAELFAYLLRENYRLQQLTLSTHGDRVVLSLLIYDRYLRLETALPYFEHLFERADGYDDKLVNEYGACWPPT